MNIKEIAPHLLDLAWWNKSAKTLNSGQVINGIEFLLTHIKELEAIIEVEKELFGNANEIIQSLNAVNKRLREVLEQELVIESPWHKKVWIMTIEEYIKAIPNDKLRTAISGLMMREGWQKAVKYINDALSKDTHEK